MILFLLLKMAAFDHVEFHVVVSSLLFLFIFSVSSLSEFQRELGNKFCINEMDIEEDSARLFERFWNWRRLNAPEFATSFGDHEYDDRLDEIGLGSYKRRNNEAQIFLKEVSHLKEVAKNGSVSDDTLLNLDLLEEDLRQCIGGLVFQTYLMPISHLEGPQLDFPRLLSWMKTESIEDFNKILARMRLFPQQIDETLKLLEEGIRLGMTMHKVSVAPLPDILKSISDLTPEESPHFKPFKERPSTITEEQWDKIVAEAKNLIEKQVLPCYKRLESFIKDEYLSKTRENIGASSLPNGEKLYKAALRFHITTDQTPQEVHDIGKKEVERITQGMEEIRKTVNFPGTLKEFREYLRTDEKFKFKSREEILQYYKDICSNITTVLPKYFENMPKAPFEIVPVPEEVEAGFPGAYYLAAPADGSRPGTFYINTYKPKSRSKYEAVALSLHEAVPGHHLQASLTMESGALVNFRRFMEDRKYYEPPGRFGMNTGYTEGWGLYSEYLGEEMGFYSDPYDLFGRLSHEMLRACRLVVDTGMHALGWSRQQAIDYMVEHTASDEHDIISEIDRYITWPGQACGYKIGEIKIKELRKLAEDSLGSKFQLKLFHDLIASMGGVPLNILEDQIVAFIESSK